nr:immunoglobulin light chain junction region [Macaca mulatta]MPN95249.1 immunoglobulin light chain junction region [Macaca mulatta]
CRQHGNWPQLTF